MTVEGRRDARRRRIRRRTMAVIALAFPLLLPAGAVGPLLPLGQTTLEVVATGLERPTGLVAVDDGTGRLLVLEQSGVVRVIGPDGRIAPDPFLDLSGKVSTGTEQGLLGLALHPDFENNGRLFVNYTDVEGDTIVAEYAAPDGAVVELDSARTLITIDQPDDIHNGGALGFGPDGLLYVGVGDGGWPDDVIQTGQNTDTLFGTIVRIDADRTTDDLPYAIPPDNPFARGGGRPEIWDYGLRNPWRFAWDAKSGDLYIADVGYLTYEEVNRHPAGIPGGLNFGWSVMEGNGCFEADTCDASGMTAPLIQYGGRRLATGDCAIVGGPVYRGNEIPEIDGRLLFGDYCSGKIWTLVVGADGTVPEEQLDTDLIISTFGLDARGRPLVADYARGVVYRINSAPGR